MRNHRMAFGAVFGALALFAAASTAQADPDHPTPRPAPSAAPHGVDPESLPHGHAGAQSTTPSAAAHDMITMSSPAGTSATAPVDPESVPNHHSMMGAGAGQIGAMQGPPLTGMGRFMNWLGRFHPVLVHFPIALFVVAGGLELAGLVLKKPTLVQGTRLLIALAAISTLVAVSAGWLLMGFNVAKDNDLHRAHRLLGTIIMLLGFATWWANERYLKLRGRGPALLYGTVLLGTILAISVNGYLGSALVRGMRHMMY